VDPTVQLLAAAVAGLFSALSLLVGKVITYLANEVRKRDEIIARQTRAQEELIAVQAALLRNAAPIQTIGSGPSYGDRAGDSALAPGR
jgi:hypothetical protein